MIQENPYLQYFCGYPGYDEKLPLTGAECIGSASQNLQHLAGFSSTQASDSMYGFGCGTDLHAKNYQPTRKRATWTVVGRPGDVVTITAICPTAGTVSSKVVLMK